MRRIRRGTSGIDIQRCVPYACCLGNWYWGHRLCPIARYAWSSVKQYVSLLVVVMLAFSDQQKKKFAHENAIDGSMSSKRVTSISMSLDLFISVDDGPFALPSVLTCGIIVVWHTVCFHSSSTIDFNMTCREEFPKILKNQGVQAMEWEFQQLVWLLKFSSSLQWSPLAVNREAMAGRCFSRQPSLFRCKLSD